MRELKKYAAVCLIKNPLKPYGKKIMKLGGEVGKGWGDSMGGKGNTGNISTMKINF